MAVSIRLRRMGRKKQPHYRIVVAESEHPRDGRFVEAIGYYKPLSDPARLVIDLERVDHWMGQGALPSGTVKSLIGKARRGGDGSVAVGEVDAETRKAERAELLAARRAAEKKKVEEAAAAEAEAKAAAKAAAEAEAAATAAAEAEAAEAEAATETEEEVEAEPTEVEAEPTEVEAEPEAAAETEAPEAAADAEEAAEEEEEEK